MSDQAERPVGPYRALSGSNMGFANRLDVYPRDVEAWLADQLAKGWRFVGSANFGRDHECWWIFARDEPAARPPEELALIEAAQKLHQATRDLLAAPNSKAVLKGVERARVELAQAALAMPPGRPDLP